MKREKQIGLVVLALILTGAIVGSVLYFTQIQDKETLVISTTTSLFDTGLLDEVKTTYEESHPQVLLAFISAGTGIAITHAMNGDADAILVHSPSQEFDFMNQSYGVNRKIVAYNFFVIVGPSDDSAGINGMNTTNALQQIYDYGQSHGTSLWVSRDDSSGTNSKEFSLWTQTGLDYNTIKEESWFLSSGSGMGTTLQTADELGLYTLADIGTYMKYYSDGLITLAKHVESDQTLINVYSVIAVNATQVEGVKFDLAMEFIRWLIGTEAQDLIGAYGQEDYGEALFNPAASIVQSQTPADVYDWIRSTAFFGVGGVLYECPPSWRTGSFGLYPALMEMLCFPLRTE
ncbi:MAG: substrate-binding domain-containing protein [Candidatus Thorarchaeota archaeon]